MHWGIGRKTPKLWRVDSVEAGIPRICEPHPNRPRRPAKHVMIVTLGDRGDSMVDLDFGIARTPLIRDRASHLVSKLLDRKKDSTRL